MPRPIKLPRPTSQRGIRAKRETQIPVQRLPIEQFGLLAGAFHHTALGSRYRKGPDDNHIYLWICGSTAEEATYECAVTLASPAGFGVFRPILQYTRAEMLRPIDLPK